VKQYIGCDSHARYSVFVCCGPVSPRRRALRRVADKPSSEIGDRMPAVQGCRVCAHFQEGASAAKPDSAFIELAT
jgi:hypothetical protein